LSEGGRTEKVAEHEILQEEDNISTLLCPAGHLLYRMILISERVQRVSFDRKRFRYSVCFQQYRQKCEFIPILFCIFFCFTTKSLPFLRGIIIPARNENVSNVITKNNYAHAPAFLSFLFLNTDTMTSRFPITSTTMVVIRTPASSVSTQGKEWCC